MAEDDSFLALVHHYGEIKHKSREGVKFTDKNPTNMFITTRTRLADLQPSIQQADEDLQVFFHYRRQLPEVRTTELSVEMFAPLASSGGSAPNPHFVNVAEPSRRVIEHELEAQLVASLTFSIYNEAKAGDYVGELGDTVIAAPHALYVPTVQRDPYPLLEEALRSDDSDHEPPFIDGDSDDDSGPTFVDKEVAVLAVKNYSIHRGVEYRVLESDHAKYLGRCKQFGQGCN
ncbi:hypothetical protein PIB30_005905 [Stylosanthes scabra]|uniref:Transposase MuDR plant domain-containing protein n=1 Tax=Stylosanthes scabra TaxID=79078 RepID=A0ABU6R4F7_9FABA|nr:hypothetical protein [Stylosanthes scabra]